MSAVVLSNVVEAINEFWFGAPDSSVYGHDRPEWFVQNRAFDQQIELQFARVMETAARGQLDMMAESALGAVALVVALDQFPRNVFRDDARAFAQDAHALMIAHQAIDKGFDADVMPVMRKFLYLPFEHSETLADQNRAVALFEALGDASALGWAVKHRDIIARFGRFPHRNAILGRMSTIEEKLFLTQPGSSF